jgi:hypothetical protein
MNVHHASEALLFRQLDEEGLDTFVERAPYTRSSDKRPRSGVH